MSSKMSFSFPTILFYYTSLTTNIPLGATSTSLGGDWGDQGGAQLSLLLLKLTAQFFFCWWFLFILVLTLLCFGCCCPQSTHTHLLTFDLVIRLREPISVLYVP